MNIKRLLKLCVIIIIVLIVSSCKMELNPKMFISDLVEVAENGSIDALYTKAIIEFEIPSKDKFAEYLTFLKKYFKEIKNAKTVDKDFETYLHAEIKLPIIKSINNEYKPTNDLVNIIVQPSAKNVFLVGIYINKDTFTEIKKYISDTYWQTIDIEDITVYLSISNDLRKTVSLDFNYVYLNNRAVLNVTNFTLPRHDEITLRLSDLLRDYIYDNGSVYFLRIKIIDKKSK